MKKYLVRDDDGTEWEDAREFVEADPHDAAEAFAKWQCHRDSECYNRYESGKFLDVKEWNTGVVTIVSVSVSFDPHFHSRIERSADQPI
jgi:hypothetical protein